MDICKYVYPLPTEHSFNLIQELITASQYTVKQQLF